MGGEQTDDGDLFQIELFHSDYTLTLLTVADADRPLRTPHTNPPAKKIGEANKPMMVNYFTLDSTLLHY